MVEFELLPSDSEYSVDETNIHPRTPAADPSSSAELIPNNITATAEPPGVIPSLRNFSNLHHRNRNRAFMTMRSPDPRAFEPNGRGAGAELDPPEYGTKSRFSRFVTNRYISSDASVGSKSAAASARSSNAYNNIVNNNNTASSAHGMGNNSFASGAGGGGGRDPSVDGSIYNNQRIRNRDSSLLDAAANTAASTSALDRHFNKNNGQNQSTDQPSGNYSVAASQDTSINASRNPNFTRAQPQQQQQQHESFGTYGDRQRRGGNTATAFATATNKSGAEVDMQNHPKSHIAQKAKDSDIDSFQGASYVDQRNRVTFANHIFGPKATSNPASTTANDSNNNNNNNPTYNAWRERTGISSAASIGSTVINSVNSVNSGVGSSLGGNAYSVGGGSTIMSGASVDSHHSAIVSENSSATGVFNPYLSDRRVYRNAYLKENAKLVAIVAGLALATLTLFMGGLGSRGGVGNVGGAQQRVLADQSKIISPPASGGGIMDNVQTQFQGQEEEHEVVDWDKVPPHLRGYYAKMLGVGEQFRGVAKSAEEQIKELQEQFDEDNAAAMQGIHKKGSAIAEVGVEGMANNNAPPESSLKVPPANLDEFSQQQKELEKNARVEEQKAKQQEEAQRQRQAEAAAEAARVQAEQEAQKAAQRAQEVEAQRQQAAAAAEAAKAQAEQQERERQQRAQEEEAQRQQQAAAAEAARAQAEQQAQQEREKQQRAQEAEAQRLQQAAAAAAEAAKAQAEQQEQQQAAAAAEAAKAQAEQQEQEEQQRQQQAAAEAVKAQAEQAAAQQEQQPAEQAPPPAMDLPNEAEIEESRQKAAEEAQRIAAAQNENGDGEGSGDDAGAIDALQNELSDLMNLLQNKGLG